MSRTKSARTDPRIARLRRQAALERVELRPGEHQERRSAASPTSLAVKVVDETTQRAIAEFLERRNR